MGCEVARLGEVVSVHGLEPETGAQSEVLSSGSVCDEEGVTEAKVHQL